MGLDLAAAGTGQHVAPPLQPDLARQGLTDDLAHARHFDVEGVEREQRVAMLRRRKQGGEETLLVRGADQRLAVGERVLHGRELSPSGSPASGAI